MIQKTKKAKKKVKTIGYRIELDLLVKVDEFAEKKNGLHRNQVFDMAVRDYVSKDHVMKGV